MNRWQLELVEEWLSQAIAWARANGRHPVFRHGDCIGADEQAAGTAAYLGFYVIAHPCTIEAKRAWCNENRHIRIPKPPLERNRDIVNGSDYMLATPGEEYELLRSGTWSTIRFARKVGKFVHIVYP